MVALFLSFLALPLSAAIAGNVISPDGQPVAGARVSVYALEPPEARFARLLSASPERPPLASAETDPKGNFSLSSPSEAVVELHVLARGYEPLATRVEKDEDLGAVALVDRPLRSGSVKSGGRPVANALVAMTYPGGPGVAEFMTRTDANGRYEAPEASQQGASIAVVHPDYAIETGFATILRPGTRDMNVSLVPGTALTGRAVAADGTTPVPNATIYLDTWPLATSGEDGAFTIARAPLKWSFAAARTGTLMGVLLSTGNKGAPLIRMEKLETISGRTIDARTKRPVAGAYVQLMRNSPGLPRVGVTDAKGTFSIAATPGESRVYVNHPAYTSPSDVTAAAGQRALSDTPLTAFARVSGVVMDEEERPLAAAMVFAQEGTRTDVPPRMWRFLSATSGADGRFTVRVQPDADVRLRAVKKGLPHAKSGTMKLAAGERKTGVVLTVPSGVAVTGRVVDANDEPVSGVAVVTSETSTRGGGTMTPSFRQSDDDVVRTAKDGTFTLRLESGTYDFAFFREGFAPAQVRAQRIAANEVTPVEAKLERAVEIAGRITRGGAPLAGVYIRAGNDERVRSAADGTFTIGGLAPGVVRLMLNKQGELVREERRITAPARDVVIDLPVGVTIGGRVTDKAARSALREFEVVVERTEAGFKGVSSSGQHFTSDDGTFTFRHVEPGPLQLVAKAPGYASARVSVEAQEGKDVTDVALELDRAARVTGRITGENGLPLAEASVQYQPRESFSGRRPRGRTNANGEYTVEGLDPGERTFRISHPKHTAVTRTVTVAGETKLDAQLSAGHRVTGTVVDEGGNAVAEAEVRASGASGVGGPVLTNASGAFEVDTLAPGRYRFVATKSGLAQGVLGDVDAATTGPLLITLRTGDTIYGRVTGLAAAEVPHAIVRAHGQGVTLSSPVDPQGNYRIDGLSPGNVRVVASVATTAAGSTRESGRREVQVVSGSPVQLDIEMRGDAVVRGRVTRNGTPLPGASVTFSPRGEGLPNASGRTDHEGRYTVSGLADGDYSVFIADSGGGARHTTMHTVRGSGTLDLEFKAGRLRGRALDAATGDGLAGISVRFHRGPGDSSFILTTGAGGAFSTPNLTPGTYRLSAWGDGYALHQRELTVGDTGTDEVELRLTKGASTTVIVVDGRTGRPVAATVMTLDGQGRVLDDVHRTPTNDPAQGVKLPLPPGTYTVHITAPGYAPVRTTLTAPASHTVAVTSGGTIRIQSRHTVPRRLRMITPGGVTPHQLRPGMNAFAHLAPGTYALELMSESGAVEETVRVTVVEGETVDASI